MKSAGKLKFFVRLFSVFYARKIRPKCVTDFWTVVFVLFRYKSSRAELEEHEISTHPPKLKRGRVRESCVIQGKRRGNRSILNITRNCACVCCFMLCCSAVFSHYQNVPWFLSVLVKRHLATIVKPATTFIKMVYPLAFTWI